MSEIRITDANLHERLSRVAAARGGQTIGRVVRDLLHERLLDMDQHGDPAAITPGVTPGVAPLTHAVPPSSSGPVPPHSAPSSAVTSAA